MHPRAPISRRHLLALAATATTSAYAPNLQAADGWKASKPIKLVVPFNAGGTSDVLARLITQSIGTALSQPFVVENKPGASGALGSQQVSVSAADGTNLVVATTDSHCIYPHIYKKPIFDPQQQIAVAPVGIIQFAMLTRQDLPVKNLQELVALANKQQLSFASWGNGSAAHVATLTFMRAAGIKDMLHVPFTGTAPAMQAVMAGQVDVVIGPVPLVVANRSRLKVIAAMTPQRVEAMADIPTFAEAGVPLSRNSGDFWIGIFAPPKTPANVVEAIAKEFNKSTALPELRKRMAELGVVHQTVANAAEYGDYFRRDSRLWADFIKSENIKAD